MKKILIRSLARADILDQYSLLETATGGCRNAKLSRLSELLVQAFRYLGKENIRPEHIDHLNRTIPSNQRKKLLKYLCYAPAWMHCYFRKLAND